MRAELALVQLVTNRRDALLALSGALEGLGLAPVNKRLVFLGRGGSKGVYFVSCSGFWRRYLTLR